MYVAFVVVQPLFTADANADADEEIPDRISGETVERREISD